MESPRRGMRVTLMSLLASIVLAGIKILSGFFGNSYALIADGFESLLDIVGSLVVLGSLRVAANPPTSKYPFGFGRIEPLAALLISTILLAAAVGITVQSIREILTPHHIPATFTLYILVGVVITKELMFRILNRAGKAIGSRAIETDAWHHRTDSLTSIAAFIGISVALLGGPGYESSDDWAALFASAVIAFNGTRLFIGAFKEVLDIAPPPEVSERIRKIALAIVSVQAVDKCRVRKSGLFYFVEIHIEIDGKTSVSEGHRIAHQVKDALLESDLGIMDVVVHIEPSDNWFCQD